MVSDFRQKNIAPLPMLYMTLLLTLMCRALGGQGGSFNKYEKDYLFLATLITKITHEKMGTSVAPGMPLILSAIATNYDDYLKLRELCFYLSVESQNGDASNETLFFCDSVLKFTRQLLQLLDYSLNKHGIVVLCPSLGDTPDLTYSYFDSLLAKNSWSLRLSNISAFVERMLFYLKNIEVLHTIPANSAYTLSKSKFDKKFNIAAQGREMQGVASFAFVLGEGKLLDAPFLASIQRIESSSSIYEPVISKLRALLQRAA